MVFHAVFFFSSRRRHTRSLCDWSSDVCSSDLFALALAIPQILKYFEHWTGGSQGIVLSKPNAPWGLKLRSEERRVGKECRSRWSRYHEKKKRTNKQRRVDIKEDFDRQDT